MPTASTFDCTCRLLNIRLSDDVDQATYARKSTEIRDRLASIKLQLDAADRSRNEMGELASNVFELFAH